MQNYIKANLTGFFLMFICSITVTHIPALITVLLLVLSLMYYVQAFVYSLESENNHEEN